MIRTIPYQQVVSEVEKLYIQACTELPEDVLRSLQAARQRETSPRACRILDQIIENAQIAAREHIPLCQDTGLAVVFIQAGANLALTAPADRPDATIDDAVNEAITLASRHGYLRKSVVTDPLGNRQNTGTNTPAVIHYSIVPGDSLTISVMAKGGGCENKSQFRVFNPTESADTVIDWIVNTVRNAGADACPPFIVGVGIGGNFESCCLLSKEALLGKISSLANEDQSSRDFYDQMAQRIREKINATGLGPMGLGGDTTALAVHIRTAPCHIASLPVAVNIECHSHRHKTITL